MGEVGGEAVAEVDAGGGEIAAQKGFADVEARFGEEVGMVFGGLGVARGALLRSMVEARLRRRRAGR